MRRTHVGGAAALFTLLSVLVGSNLSLNSVQTHSAIVDKTRTYNALSTASVSSAYTPGNADYLQSVCKQGVFQWQADKCPIKVYITPGESVPGYRPAFSQMVRTSFDTWASASGDKLSWTEVPTSSEADVRVVWTDSVTQRSNGTEAGETNAFTQLNKATGHGVIYGARMQLLTRLPNKLFSDNDMSKTILHETGHALGLQGHSPNPTDIMYYAINAQQSAVLTTRDEATMAHLYSDYPTADNIALKSGKRSGLD
jgi:predicted Zn-dependent protease